MKPIEFSQIEKIRQNTFREIINVLMKAEGKIYRTNKAMKTIARELNLEEFYY